MAEKKSKSDRDMITEAVLAAANKRLDTMTGDEIKASADRMAAQPVLKEFETAYPRGSVEYDKDAKNWERRRIDWERSRQRSIDRGSGHLNLYEPYEMQAPPPVRAQEYGPWEKGQPLGSWGRPLGYQDPPPYPFVGSTQMPGFSPWDVRRPSRGPGSDYYDERTPAKVDPADVHRAVMGDYGPPPGQAEEILKDAAKKPKSKK